MACRWRTYADHGNNRLRSACVMARAESHLPWRVAVSHASTGRRLAKVTTPTVSSGCQSSTPPELRGVPARDPVTGESGSAMCVPYHLSEEGQLVELRGADGSQITYRVWNVSLAPIPPGTFFVAKPVGGKLIAEQPIDGETSVKFSWRSPRLQTACSPAKSWRATCQRCRTARTFRSRSKQPVRSNLAWMRWLCDLQPQAKFI